MFALTSSKKLVVAAVCAAALGMLPALAFAQDDDPPPEAGRVSYISGNVSVQPATSDQWGQAYPNLPVGPGDRIFTDSDGRAEIQLGQTYVRIGPNTDVTLVDASQFDINFGVAQGSIRLHSFGLWPRQLLDVSTPNGNAEFGQQGDLRVDVMPENGATVFTNLGQFADITAAGDFRQELDYGQSLEVAGTNPVSPQWLQPAGPDDLDSWSQQRDQQLANVASYQYVSPDVAGAADLDAYGDWQPQTEYGAMWFPRDVPADWQPYHYGHWINREPWGWVWVEDESWGYAPFHYGRWVSYRGRWGWVPGPVNVRPVWSPALVVFAGGFSGGGGGLSVWFPLGPGEPYRPWYRCSPRYIDQVNITNIREAPRVRVERSYVNIVNVTNITYVNRTYVTAVRRDDFASGRSVRNVAVRVDPREVQQIRPLNRPDVAPPARPIVTRPVAHPVRVSNERPVLINQQGREIAARPHATPVAPPVRPVTQPRQIPGRTAIAAPTHVTAPGRPGQFPTEQGNRQQQPNNRNQNPSFPDRGVPRANPVGPVQGIQRPLTPGPGNQQPNQPGNPSDRQQGQPPAVTGRPMPPPQNLQRPEQPNYQQQQPPNRPQNPQQPQYRPEQRPNQPNYPQQRPPNQPNYPEQRQPNQPNYPQQRPPEQPNYPQQRPPNQPENPQQRQYRPDNGPNQPQQRPNQPNYPQQRQPNQPENPQQRQYRPDNGPNQNYPQQRQPNEAPRPPQNNVQQYRPVPPPVQGRPAPPTEPNRSADRPNNRQQNQQQARPRDEGQKQNNRDQKKDEKKDDKKHN